MRTAKFSLPILLVAASLAGCGGGGGSAKLSSADIAVVGKQHVAKTDFDALFAQAKRNYQQQGRKFPKQGTSDYEALKGQMVTLLVQQAERTDKAASMGISISDKAVNTRLDLIKKQYFKGDEKKYQAKLKESNLTDAQVREDIRAQLVSEALANKLTKDVAVSDKDVHQYYVQHPQLYAQPQTRDLRYILVGKDKAIAESVYRQLKAGNAKTWCTLAKKYAKDASGQSCGKATFSKGQTVPAFDTVAFSAPANVVHAPFYDPTQYKSWFVIEPLGPVKAKSTTPEKQVAASIRQQLLQQKKTQTMTDFVKSLTSNYCGGSKIKYQVGYAPSPDPCASTSTNATTT